MTAPVAEFVLDAGVPNTLTLTYCSAVPGFPGVPGPVIDVTGYTAKMTVRSSYGDGAALTMESGGGGITVGGPDGAFVIQFTAEESAQLPSRGVFDVMLTPTGPGTSFRLIQGTLIARQQVTV